MTRKDYELIAKAVQAGHAVQHEADDRAHWAIDATAVCIADALASDNSRFDRERFLRACGVEA